MNDNKEYGNLCKSHSARSEKEFCRVCPSKLNKKELEDVYFSLVEDNLEHKRTINNQRDKIKMLSTKIQRLTALQKIYLGKEPKDCCGSKVVINEQKERILELQKSNQCLSERVRQLNMRFCSAKQFLKRSPFQSTSRCNRCSTKSGSMSALISKRSESNLRTAVASSQYLDKDLVTSRTVENDVTSHEKGVQYDHCIENKCRTHIEELKQKNDELQEELSRVMEEGATVRLHYEQHLDGVRAELLQARGERALADERSQQWREEASALVKRVGVAELRCDELSVELSIEKRKVLELEMRVKSADMSNRIANALEAHLGLIKTFDDSTVDSGGSVLNAIMSATPHVGESPRLTVSSPPYKPTAAIRTKIPHLPTDEVLKSSDDSGYTDTTVNRSQDVADNKASSYINQVLLEKVADLQNQINNMKVSKVYNMTIENLSASEFSEFPNNGITPSNMTEEIQTFPYKFDENAISESSESIITEKRLNTEPFIKDTHKKGEKFGNDGEEQTIECHENNNQRDIFSENEMYSEKVLKAENGQTEHKEFIKRSIKQFKRRSKEKSNETGITSRKLSIDSSKESLAEKSLLKTGSLDENRIELSMRNDRKENSRLKPEGRINKPNTPKDTAGLVKSDQKTKKETVAKEIKRDDPGGTSTLSLHIHNEKANQSHGKPPMNLITDNNTIVETDVNVKNKDNVKNKEKNDIKDSDSSKGTYSIHKGDNNKLTGDKDIDCTNARNRENKITTEKEGSRNILSADVKKNVMSSIVMNNKVNDKRRSSTPSLARSRTYVIPSKVKSSPESPDSTECEISSLSDLPSERHEIYRRTYRSPGEDRLTATVSETRTDTTTTDYGSLSEGELPYVGDTSLSAGETRTPHRAMKSNSLPASTSKHMEETLKAVKEELSRCTNLIKVHSRRSLQGTHGIRDRIRM